MKRWSRAIMMPDSAVLGCGGGAVGYRKTAPAVGQTAVDYHGWITYCLPYVEQDNLVRGYRYDLPYKDAVNVPVGALHLRVLSCPSAPDGRDFTSGAMTDYSSTNVFITG